MHLELTLQTAEMKSSMRATSSATQPAPAISSDWRQQLPVLMGEGIALRELQISDAPALLTLLTTEEVTRFISRKLGAVQEGILRKSFLRGGKYLDQALWAIVEEDWYRSKAVWGAKSAASVN